MFNLKKGQKYKLTLREADFKSDTRLHFCLILQNLFSRFLTAQFWKDSDMIDPSIECFDFLFSDEKIFEFDFSKFCGKQTKEFHEDPLPVIATVGDVPPRLGEKKFVLDENYLLSS